MQKEDLHTLAGLQASVYGAEIGQNGDFESMRVFINQFYPGHMTAPKLTRDVARLFKQKSQSSLTPLEESFRNTLASAQAKTTDAHQLKVLYLQLCWSKPFYG